MKQQHFLPDNREQLELDWNELWFLPEQKRKFLLGKSRSFFFGKKKKRYCSERHNYWGGNRNLRDRHLKARTNKTICTAKQEQYDFVPFLQFIFWMPCKKTHPWGSRDSLNERLFVFCNNMWETVTTPLHKHMAVHAFPARMSVRLYSVCLVHV